jgi:16S rRNA G527 N7-methylase RsmG
VIFFFSLYLILPAALGPGVYSASRINEYQKQKNNVSGSRARSVRRADNLTNICEPMPRQCGNLNISQLRGLLRGLLVMRITWIASVV